MKVAYYILHYGREWLYWSIRSIMNHVDRIYIFYTETPSHGHASNLKNPENREELKLISEQDYSTEVIWVDCPHFYWEGEHRDFATKRCEDDGAELILIVDADELWDPVTLNRAIDTAVENNKSINRIGMMHFWRSVKWVCNDPAMPVRIIIPNGIPPENYLPGKVFHFGYAQSPEIIKYKQSIHGHKNEWRRGWFEDIFLPWKPGDGDVHPTNLDFWFPEEYFDNDQILKIFIGDHPYYDLAFNTNVESDGIIR